MILNNYKSVTDIIVSFITTLIHYLIGGIDIWIKTLGILMVLDVMTGLAKAIMGVSEKTKKGFLDSTIMWQGGIKKLLTLIVICVATIINQLISPDSMAIRTFTISYYIATEALSVLENVSACGLPLPKHLTHVLEKLETDSEKIK